MSPLKWLLIFEALLSQTQLYFIFDRNAADRQVTIFFGLFLLTS